MNPENLDNSNVAEKKKPRRKRAEVSTFAKNLNRLIQERGLSHRVVSQLANVSQSTLAGWTAGDSPSDLSKVAALAKALGVSFSYLCLGLENDPSADDIVIEDLYDEEPVAFQGLFRIQATKLVRKNKK